MTEKALVTVVVLCRNNPAALVETLQSACSQHPVCDVLVIDGSDNACCEQALKGIRHRGKLVYRREPPAGPYTAMNAALAIIETPWLQFLHSGDMFVGPFSVAALLDHAQRLEVRTGRVPAAVFGQTWMEAPAPLKQRWLSPDPQVQHLLRWLRHMVPCHQSVLFATSWAQQHPYNTRSHICADRPVVRLALALSGEQSYLPLPICRYRLDGLSSQLPTWRELQRRWREPDRSPLERLAELGKFILRPLGPHYVLLMQIRARSIGWLCQ